MINVLQEKKVLFMEWIRYGIAALLILVLAFFLLVHEKNSVTGQVVVEIGSGSTLKTIAQELRENDLISSESIFNIYAFVTGNTESLKSGSYVFEESQSIAKIVKRLATHDTQETQVSVTLFEGFTRVEMTQSLQQAFRDFDAERFLKKTEEGYLFPDTYTFFETADVDKVIAKLEETHEEVVTEILEEYGLPEGLSKEDWIILASIVEKEANTADSRRRVADILLRRLDEGMALQVDATFVYGVRKDSFTLTTEDLLDDHEYNTYTRKGLPPTPISNPGKDALISVLDPIPNTAVYFLTGLDGVMYYADTYSGHLENRRVYLGK